MRTGIEKKLIAGILLINMMVLTGCGASLYEDNKSDYTQVTAVDGVVFDMPEAYLSAATAVTAISNEVDYGTDTYLYKDGSANYLMFNIGYVVVAVKSGTTFDLYNTADVEASVTGNDINGIWLRCDGKNLEYKETGKEDNYKLIADVIGDVSVTPTVYGRFAGKLAYVSSDSYECSMFVGILGDSNEELSTSEQRVVEHIAKSLAISEDFNDTQYDTQYDTQNNTQDETETAVKSEIETTETLLSENETETESHGIDLQLVPESETTVEESNSKQDDIPKDSEKSYVTVESNQKTTEGGTYSDIYHLLGIGDTGRLFSLSNDGQSLEIAYLTVNNLYTGEEAENIIKKYCNSAECLYEYEDAPAGYSWHVIEYTTDTAPEDLYIDIRLRGLDGGKLKFRGVAASERTHDISVYTAKTENGYEKQYCYYAVPNGCTEYMLECGKGINETGDTACFRISNWQVSQN